MIDGLEYSLTQTEVQIDGELVGVFPDKDRDISVDGVEYTTEEMIECVDYIVDGLVRKNFISGTEGSVRTISSTHEEAKGNNSVSLFMGKGFIENKKEAGEAQNGQLEN